MPLSTMTAVPTFWHSPEGQPQAAQQLSDVKSSDRKARVLLRRLRPGSSKKTLVVVASTANAAATTTTTATRTSAESQQRAEEQQQPQVGGEERQGLETAATTPVVAGSETDRPATSTPSLVAPSEAETETTTVAAAAEDPPVEEELPVLPAYVARPGVNERPPPYAGQILPPALPGYTPLPLPGTVIALPPQGNDPARDLKRPGSSGALLPHQRRYYYRNALRRRVAATKRLFGLSDRTAETATATAEDPSGRGVVMYRDRHDQWVGADDLDEIDELKMMQARQTGLKGWLRRVWAGVKDFMEEHPMLFFVALFVIIVVALCVLI